MLANPQMATASLRTMQRYRANGVQPLRMNGNKPIPKISGEELEMLVFYRFAYPSATAGEISAFIYRNSPYTDHLLSRQDIYRTEKYLKLSTKQLSTTAMYASFCTTSANASSFVLEPASPHWHQWRSSWRTNWHRRGWLWPWRL